VGVIKYRKSVPILVYYMYLCKERGEQKVYISFNLSESNKKTTDRPPLWAHSSMYTYHVQR